MPNEYSVASAGLSVPKEWGDITAEWMTVALAQRHPEVRVGQVDVELRDDGTNRCARLALSYLEGEGPATVFLEAGDPAHKELIRATSGLFHEQRLFTAGVSLPLDHPAVYAAVVDEADYDFVPVMEDVVARGADPRDGTRPLTIEQAACGVQGLARLHGRFWNCGDGRYPELDWVEPFAPCGGWRLRRSRPPSNAWVRPRLRRFVHSPAR